MKKKDNSYWLPIGMCIGLALSINKDNDNKK